MRHRETVSPFRLLARVAVGALSCAGVASASGAVAPATFEPRQSCNRWTAETNREGAGFGWSVASAGDVDGDGHDDVVVSATYYASFVPIASRVHLFRGSPGGLEDDPAWTVVSPRLADDFGRSVAGAGDVNGDGYDDVIVGAPLHSDGEVYEGRAELYLGSANGLGASPSWRVESNASAANFGSSVAGVGDVNGDGFDDVIVGAPRYSGGLQREGRAYVYLGGEGGLPESAAWIVESNAYNVQLGTVVAGAGDVNGDGFDDALVSAPGFGQGGTRRGRVFLYHGSVDGLLDDAAWSVDGDQDEAELGYSLAPAGDVNGDGYDDVLVGTPYWVNNLPNAPSGRAWAYYGSASGLSAAADWTAESGQAYDFYGEALASVGDVDGDGFADVVVGASGYTTRIGQVGRVFGYHGSASGLSSSAVWTAQTKQTPLPYFGSAVSSAGDSDGDGYSELLVGARGFDNGEVNEGRAFAYYGSPYGLDGNAAWVGTRSAPSNPSSYVATAPVLGGTWTATVDLTTTGHTHAQILGYASPRAPAFLPGGQVVLVGGSATGRLPLQPGPLAAWSVQVPSDPSLCGRTIHTQAVHLFGVQPFALSNAQDVRIGD